ESGALPLMQNYDPVLMPGQRGVDQFARQNGMSFWQHKNHKSKLTSLRLVHSQCVGKLQRGVPFLPKITAVEIVGVSLLRRELYLRNLWIAIAFPLAYNNPDLAICQVSQSTL